MSCQEGMAMPSDIVYRLKRAILVVVKKSDVFKSREH